MAIARANGKLKGKQPKLNARQRSHLLGLHDAGAHTISEIAELFSVSRATVYREIARARRRPATPAAATPDIRTTHRAL
jgi:DNA invertase Pin-like site-specific DNA recombinase